MSFLWNLMLKWDIRHFLNKCSGILATILFPSIVYRRHNVSIVTSLHESSSTAVSSPNVISLFNLVSANGVSTFKIMFGFLLRSSCNSQFDLIPCSQFYQDRQHLIVHCAVHNLLATTDRNAQFYGT